MTRVPYLRAERLHVDMDSRPKMPFFVIPADYLVIDGKTIRVLAPAVYPLKTRERAFDIVLDGITTVLPQNETMSDQIMRSVGIDPNMDDPGSEVLIFLQRQLLNSTIFVEPKGLDKHRNLKALVALSGTTGDAFDLKGARSLERMMVKWRMAEISFGYLNKIPEYPEVLTRLRQRLEAEGRA